MAGMLYYLPGESRQVSLETIRAAGLSYAFDSEGPRPVARECSRGPDGGDGVIVADERCAAPHKIGYFPDLQTWARMPGTFERRSWAGFYKAERPGPEDLARVELLDGHSVTLGDGQRWLIPVARGASEQEDELAYYQALPAGTTVDESGAWRRNGVLPCYAALWQIALNWWDALAQAIGGTEPAEGKGKSQVSFDFAGENDAALVALSANYRVGKAEVAMLGLFNDQCVPLILGALVDWPTVQAWLKKKATACPPADGSSTGDGGRDAAKDTGPP